MTVGSFCFAACGRSILPSRINGKAGRSKPLTGRKLADRNAAMLHLKTPSPDRWLEQVDRHLEQVLIDHAHCEKKAASAAMNLIFAYVDQVPLVLSLSEIVTEELEHFALVLRLLERRQIPFRRIPPSNYGPKLNALVRGDEPGRAIDRFLVAALIEARSCERFDLLRKHMADRELAEFYGSLFESEARHYATYVRLAQHFAPADQVHARLVALAEAEAAIIAEGDTLPRMHS
jgi:tRNA-(ms[2]io[6]A)-hydroxylase